MLNRRLGQGDAGLHCLCSQDDRTLRCAWQIEYANPEESLDRYPGRQLCERLQLLLGSLFTARSNAI